MPDYPLGSDFTEVEQRPLKALGWLKAHAAGTTGKLRTTTAALLSGGVHDSKALQRMELDAPKNIGERLYAKLLRHALAKTALQGNHA